MTKGEAETEAGRSKLNARIVSLKPGSGERPGLSGKSGNLRPGSVETRVHNDRNVRASTSGDDKIEAIVRFDSNSRGLIGTFADNRPRAIAGRVCSRHARTVSLVESSSGATGTRAGSRTDQIEFHEVSSNDLTGMLAGNRPRAIAGLECSRHVRIEDHADSRIAATDARVCSSEGPTRIIVDRLLSA